MPSNLSLQLHPDALKALVRLCERTGVPRSVILARLLDRYMNDSDVELPVVLETDLKPPPAPEMPKPKRRIEKG